MTQPIFHSQNMTAVQPLSLFQALTADQSTSLCKDDFVNRENPCQLKQLSHAQLDASKTDPGQRFGHSPSFSGSDIAHVNGYAPTLGQSVIQVPSSQECSESSPRPSSYGSGTLASPASTSSRFTPPKASQTRSQLELSPGITAGSSPSRHYSETQSTAEHGFFQSFDHGAVTAATSEKQSSGCNNDFDVCGYNMNNISGNPTFKHFHSSTREGQIFHDVSVISAQPKNPHYIQATNHAYGVTKRGHDPGYCQEIKCPTEAQNRDLGFRGPSYVSQKDTYNQRGVDTLGPNGYMSAGFAGTKPYRSFSSELNSPDLPLAEDLEMDFEFPLALGVGEAGFENFMSYASNGTSGNITASSSSTINNNNSSSSGSSVEKYATENNSSSSSNCRSGSTIINNNNNNNNNNSTGEGSRLNMIPNIKQEATCPDLSSMTCSGSYSTFSMATGQTDGHVSKAGVRKFDNQFSLSAQTAAPFRMHPQLGYDSQNVEGRSPAWQMCSPATSHCKQMVARNPGTTRIPSNQDHSNAQPGDIFSNGNFQTSETQYGNFHSSNSTDLNFHNENLQNGNSQTFGQICSSNATDRNNLYSNSPYILSFLTNNESNTHAQDIEIKRWPTSGTTDHVTYDRKPWLPGELDRNCQMRSGCNRQNGLTHQFVDVNVQDGFAKIKERSLGQGANITIDPDINKVTCRTTATDRTDDSINNNNNSNSNSNNNHMDDGDCYGDAIDGNLIPTFVRPGDGLRANSDSGRRAVARYFQHQSEDPDQPSDSVTASLINTAIQRIIQNSPSVEDIPTDRDIFRYSYNNSHVSRLLEGHVTEAEERQSGSGRNERKPVKRRKSQRGSTEDVSTTTSTPSPMAPTSSSSPPIPLTASGSFPATPLAAGKTTVPSTANENTGNTNVTSSSKPEKRRPSVLPPCRVCCSKASGLHYGVVTCEACNGFFRRSLKRGAIYLCSKDKVCDVKGKKRGECSYCRYQKCLSVGMSKSAVKTGRYSDKTRLAYAIETENQNKANVMMNELAAMNEMTSDPLNIHEMHVTNSTCPSDFELFDKHYK